MFDFFMSDRAKDNNAMLEELDISDEDSLNCNAHILLCITSTADKVFKDVESSAGLHKLIGEGALYGWNNANSVWYLGLNSFIHVFNTHFFTKATCCCHKGNLPRSCLYLLRERQSSELLYIHIFCLEN